MRSRIQTARTHRSLQLQTLAARCLMAGDVSVPVVPVPDVSPLPWVELFTIDHATGQHESQPNAQPPKKLADIAIAQMMNDHGVDFVESPGQADANINFLKINSSRDPVSYLKLDASDFNFGTNSSSADSPTEQFDSHFEGLQVTDMRGSNENQHSGQQGSGRADQPVEQIELRFQTQHFGATRSQAASQAQNSNLENSTDTSSFSPGQPLTFQFTNGDSFTNPTPSTPGESNGPGAGSQLPTGVSPLHPPVDLTR